MPDDLDDLRERMAALEQRLESESGLRAMMDTDQSSLTTRLDAVNHLLSALSITQSDHTARLTRVEEGQRSQAETLGRVEAGIREIVNLLRGNGGEER